MAKIVIISNGHTLSCGAKWTSALSRRLPPLLRFQSASELVKAVAGPGHLEEGHPH